jgi:aryl-alcohol dehydrogenase-like predicted oxidoreductase
MRRITMNYRFFVDTGVEVSELAMGTQTWGWVADEKTSHELADCYLEAGGNFFDTANIYNDGVSETMLGSWLKKRGGRDRLFISSKVFFPVGDGPNQSGLSRTHVLRSVDESLERLNTDYIDLYQAHCYDYTTAVEETLRVFNDLVSCGKIRFAGVSNWLPSQLMKAIQLCRNNRCAPIVSLQAEYSLIVREAEWELLPLCRQEKVGFLAWSPLAGGWLTAKYRKDKAAPENSRVGRKDRWDDQPEQRDGESTWRIIEALLEVERITGKSPAQISLNWILQQPGKAVPILGARTVEQLRDNLGCTGWRLKPEELEILNSSSKIPLPYPHRFVDRYAKRRDGG